MRAKRQLKFSIPKEWIDEELRNRIAPHRPEDIRLVLDLDEDENVGEQATEFAKEIAEYVLGEKF